MIIVDPKDWKVELERRNCVLKAGGDSQAHYYTDNGDGEEMLCMETEYVPAEDFVQIARSRDDKRELKNIEGFQRWVFTREDGTQYILRPQTDE